MRHPLLRSLVTLLSLLTLLTPLTLSSTSRAQTPEPAADVVAPPTAPPTPIDPNTRCMAALDILAGTITPPDIATPTALAAATVAAAANATAAAAPTPAATPGVVATLAPLAGPQYGVSVFLWGRPETTQRDLALVKAAGLQWQKTLVPWRAVEGYAKNAFKWRELDRVVRASNDAGIRMIARVDTPPEWARADCKRNGPPDYYQDYADFVGQLARRYRAGSDKGHIDAIQIMNEPNLSREWGDAPIHQQQAADYVRLLKLSYQAIKAADPSIIVVTAGLSPTGVADGTAQPDDVYLQWLYDAGMKGYYDALGAHGAGYGSPPETEILSDPKYPHPSFYFRRVEQLREIMVRNGEANRQIWLMEFGWTTDRVHPDYAWYAVSEEQRADYIVRAFRFAYEHWRPWIGVMTLWNLPDPGWTEEREEYWWGITNPDGSPRPAYEALVRARQAGELP